MLQYTSLIRGRIPYNIKHKYTCNRISRRRTTFVPMQICGLLILLGFSWSKLYIIIILNELHKRGNDWYSHWLTLISFWMIHSIILLRKLHTQHVKFCDELYNCSNMILIKHCDRRRTDFNIYEINYRFVRFYGAHSNLLFLLWYYLKHSLAVIHMIQFSSNR